jgi:hypothetical protein
MFLFYIEESHTQGSIGQWDHVVNKISASKMLSFLYCFFLSNTGTSNKKSALMFWPHMKNQYEKGRICLKATWFWFWNCRSMCEIDLPLSGRKNDKQLFAHGYPLYFLKHRLYTLSPCTSASQLASVQRRKAI